MKSDYVMWRVFAPELDLCDVASIHRARVWVDFKYVTVVGEHIDEELQSNKELIYIIYHGEHMVIECEFDWAVRKMREIMQWREANSGYIHLMSN